MHSYKHFIAISFLLVFIFFSTGQKVFSVSDWTLLGTAGFSDDENDYNSMVVDSDGNPYIGYKDWGNSQKAVVKMYDGNDWVSVGPSTGFSADGTSYNSMAIDSSDNLYMAYQDGANSSKTTVMKYNGSSWSALGSAGLSQGQATYQSMAINPSDDVPYVAYCDVANSSRVSVKRYNGSAWETVGSLGFTAGTSSYVSLAFSDDGTPYVAYEDGGNSDKLSVMKYNGSAWVQVGTAGISGDSSAYISMDVDSDGTPYVAFQDSNASQKLSVVKYNGSAWVTVGTLGFSPTTAQYISFLLDSNDTPYVGFKNINTNKINVMSYNGSAWVAVGSTGFSADQVYFIALTSFGSTIYAGYSDAGFSYKAVVKSYASNANPSDPTSLGPAGMVDGSTDNSNQPTFDFNLSDSNGSDTVKYKIQIDDTSNFSSAVVDYTSALAAQGSASFTVGQAAGSGTYTTGTASQTLSDGSYYWRVKAIDNNSAESSYATANSGVVAFVVDATAPTLAEITPISSGTLKTPSYIFSSDEAGDITYGGDCTSTTTTATSGSNTITFSELGVGIHSNCTVTVTDDAGNASNALSVTAFTVNSRPTQSSYTGFGTTGYTPANLPSNNLPTYTNANTITYTNPNTPVNTKGFVRDLARTTRGEDVRSLQRFLNQHKFTVSDSGAGSPGWETNYFGPKTKAALIKFQIANNIPATGYFGPQTRTLIQKY